jgi:hypothetical protein
MALPPTLDRASGEPPRPTRDPVQRALWLYDDSAIVFEHAWRLEGIVSKRLDAP